jgi:hypothetical protein
VKEGVVRHKETLEPQVQSRAQSVSGPRTGSILSARTTSISLTIPVLALRRGRSETYSFYTVT